MMPDKRKLILFLITFIILYGVYSFCFETDIYLINYPERNTLNYADFDQYHRANVKRFVISNPPKEKLDLLNYLVENSDLWLDYRNTEIKGFTFFKERWYLNRYFTTLDLVGQTVSEAIEYGHPENTIDEVALDGVSTDNQENLYIPFGNSVNPYLVYFPFGHSRQNSDLHWFLKYWSRAPDGSTSEKLVPAYLSLPDSLRRKSHFQELLIPAELKDPRNNDKWPWIKRK